MRRIILLLLLLPLLTQAQVRQSGAISFTPQWNYKISGSDTTWQFGNTLMSPQQFPFILTKWQSDQRYAPIAGGGYVPTSRTIAALYGLIGGGDLTTNRSFIVDTANIVTKTYGTRWLTQTSAASTYQPILGFTAVPITRTLTIGTTTADLSTNRTFLLGNLTNGVGVSSLSYDGTGSTTVKVDTANITSKTYFNTNIGTATAASISTKGTGTVTSITPGYGFTSSTPITTSGTMTIDTAKLLTVTGARDNVASLYSKSLFSPQTDYLLFTSGNILTAPTPSGSNVTFGKFASANFWGFKGSSGNIVTFSWGGLSANRTFTFPNSAGTFALTTIDNAFSQPQSMTGLNIYGAAGQRNINLSNETVASVNTPVSAVNFYGTGGNSIGWKNTSGFNALVSSSTISTDRTYTFPDATGTIALTSNSIPNNATTTPSSGYGFNIDGSGNVGGKLGTGFATTPTAQLESYSATNTLFTARNSTTTSTELITATNDRTFSGTNNWTGTNWTFSGGLATHTPGSTAAATLPNANLTVASIIKGRYYVVNATFSGHTAGSYNVALGGANSLVITQPATGFLNGDFSTVVIAGADNADLTVVPGTTSDGSFTNISIKQIVPGFNIDNYGNVAINSNQTVLNNGTSAAVGNNLASAPLLSLNRSYIGKGTINVTASGTTVLGFNTNFQADINPGDIIYANGESHTVTAVSNYNLTTDAWTNNYTGSYTLDFKNPFSFYNVGRQVITSSTTGGAALAITNSNSVGTNVTLQGINSTANYAATSASSNSSVNAGSFTLNILSANNQNLTSTAQAQTAVHSAINIQSGATGTISRFGNYYGTFANSASGATITDGYINRIQSFANSGTITNMMGYNTPAFTGGTITNQTHLLLGATTAVTGNWAFYNATAFNNFLGTANTQIGSAAATAGAPKLDVTGTIGSTALATNSQVYTDANSVLTTTIPTGLTSILKYAHTIFTPATGGTVALVNNQYNIINPAGALLALTVNLPSSPSNNDVVYIKFTQSVTTVTYGNGTVVDGITAPTAGGLTVLTYDSGTTSWY